MPTCSRETHGQGTVTGRESCGGVPCSTSSVEVMGLSGVTSVSAASMFACALLTGGAVKCWGGNYTGQLATGVLADSWTPVAVKW